jgi:adenosylmethionine-8-amino-7-oxononanoate aminotransferase
LITAGAVVAGACVATGAVVAEFVAAVVAPELFAGFALFVAAAVAFVVATAVLEEFEDDDEADALCVVSTPATGAPAILIALVDPN